jgi:hypothetical protein
MKIKTPKNLIAIAALAIMLLGARTTFAYVPGVWDPQPRVDTGETSFTIIPGPMDPAPYTPYSQTPPNTEYHATYVQPTHQTVNSAPTSGNQTNVESNNSQNNIPPVVSDQSQNNGLTALSFQGNGGFLPSSIWQWFLVVLLILIVIIIARSFKKREEHHIPAH